MSPSNRSYRLYSGNLTGNPVRQKFILTIGETWKLSDDEKMIREEEEEEEQEEEEEEKEEEEEDRMEGSRSVRHVTAEVGYILGPVSKYEAEEG